MICLVTDPDPEGVITTTAGRRIGYLIRGPRNGRPVMYLHGMPSCRREQRLFPDAVLDRFGIRLVSIDRPGWGETDPLEGDRVARSADALAICDALKIGAFPLVAVSAGGTYALALAAAAPDRVERVILASAQMPYDDEAAIRELQPDQLALLPALRLGRIDPVIAGAEQYRSRLLEDPMVGLAPSMATLTRRERDFAEQPWARDALTDEIREGLRLRVDGLLDDLLAWPRPFEIDLDTVRCPVRAIHGTADDWEPLPNLQRVLRLLDDTQIVLLEGLNHFGPLLYPNLVMNLATSGE